MALVENKFGYAIIMGEPKNKVEDENSHPSKKDEVVQPRLRIA